MIIALRTLQRFSTFSLIAVLIILGGCSFFSAEPVPINYTHAGALGVGQDTVEPFGIAVKDDVVYVSDGGAGVIRTLDTESNSEVFARGLHTPSAIAFLPSGELIVADTGSQTIRKISADGTITIVAGVENATGSADGPVASATFNSPVGVAVTSDGSIFVADTYNDRIRVIRDGIVTTVAGERRGFADGVNASASFDTPLGIAVWEDKLLVADSGNARIRVVETSGVVSTLAGGVERGLIDGSLGSARFGNPTAIAVNKFGTIFVADGNAIRVIGRRVLPLVETLSGDQRGFLQGQIPAARFSRPSGLAFDSRHELFVADSDNRVVRIISEGQSRRLEKRKLLIELDDEPYPLAARWPFDPPSNPREVAGTLGEVRGEVKPGDKPVWFHNGLDIAGAYGETTKFIRDEAVLDPHAAENFGTSRELLRMPLIGYIHLRLGRDKDNRIFEDPRFQFEFDSSGKPVDLRIARGTRFAAGDVIGTLNSMNHVHLIAGRIGREINALAALNLPGVADSIPPVIEDVSLFTSEWQKLSASSPVNVSEKSRIVVRAYDRMDGNSERRRLGVYRVGYQLFSNGSPLGEIEWRISFERSPSNDAVRLAYADGSRSGYTPDTFFNYIVTNRVDGENAREDFLETTNLAPGKYVIRVFAADYFGNIASKDVEVLK